MLTQSCPSCRSDTAALLDLSKTGHCCSTLPAAGFLLRRGRFRPLLAHRASACPSTGCHDGTHRHVLQVHGRVDVAVVHLPALRARPLPRTQRQLFPHVPAARAHLAARVPAIDKHYPAAAPGRLVFELTAQLRPPHVGNRARQAPVPQQAFHVQVLDADGVEAAHDAGRELVQAIPAQVADPGMQLRQFQFRLAAAARTFHLTRQRARQAAQARQQRAQRLRSGPHFAVGQGG